MTAWPGVGALAGLLACAHTAPAQTSSVTPTRALAPTLEAIVNEGAYAGIVAKLEPIVGLETTYPVSAVFSQPRWYVRLPPIGSPTRALLAVHEDAWRHVDGTGPRLVDARASVCLALLRRPVHRVYAGSFHHVFIAVTADAMRRTPRFGTVGSGGACTPPPGLRTRLVIASGPTFMDALDQAVQQAGGVAWLAAENGRGQCGIGFVAPAQPLHHGVDCVGTVTVEQPPTSPLRGK